MSGNFFGFRFIRRLYFIATSGNTIIICYPISKALLTKNFTESGEKCRARSLIMWLKK